MATSTLPVIDLATLSSSNGDKASNVALATQLGKALEHEGFAYLINVPLSLEYEDVFGLARRFFQLSETEKLRLAKKTFQKYNSNTYRGYFPSQSGSDNLKEGFEVGTSSLLPSPERAGTKIDLTEANVWPPESLAPGLQEATEKLYAELQMLSSKLLALLAIALGKEASYVDHYLNGSISTLRYLHYPAIIPPSPQRELCCTPHTDSGILTLLHQDSTGGLEVLSPDGQWVSAPYVPGSLVVNIGDLMAKVSGGRFRATYHRVRSSPGKERYSVPFFFEPGVNCRIRSVDEDDEAIVYGDHVLSKMKGWVEFQDQDKSSTLSQGDRSLPTPASVKMKSLVVSAVFGAVALAIHGVNAAAIPNSDAKLTERQEHCWEAPDGQVHCSLGKRQEHCWEAPDGQVHCSLGKRQEHCWEAPDGQVHCSLGKRQEHCWEAPDGQVHCSLGKRQDLDKRQEHCWEAPDGQVHCSLGKRQEHCWEAPDGQVHCSLAKRQELDKRQEHCWEAPDGQVHCSLGKRQEHCWEAPDGQVHCSLGKREELLGERNTGQSCSIVIVEGEDVQQGKKKTAQPQWRWVCSLKRDVPAESGE
ncbi:MAG: hypothetical protein Q9220_004631 [cf. Caloplaca sp. 1 TL-2023]